MRLIRRRKLVLLLGVLLALGGAVGAWAGMFGTFFTLEGILESPYDFGFDTVAGRQVGPQQATVLFQEFVLQPGITTGWHYHRGLSYVVLVRGTIQEQKGADCSTLTHSPGTAFLENPYEVHSVTNNGPKNAILIWATVFPSNDFPPGNVFSGLYTPPAAPCQ